MERSEAVRLRFGISAMQFGRLLREAGSPETLLAYVAGFDHAAAVAEQVDAGFGTVELGADLALFFTDAFATPAIERLATLADARGVRYTVHLPMWSVEPSSPQEPVRRGSVQALVAAVRATLPLDPEVYVLHATNALAAEFARRPLPAIVREPLLGLFQDRARQSVRELLAETGLPSRRLAIETIEFPFEMTLALAEELDLSLCFDAGHVLAGFSGPVDVFDALEQALPRLAEIHLHDAPRPGPDGAPRDGEDHRPLGAGDLDTARLLDRLTGANFAGPVVFELTQEEALASLATIRELRPGAVGETVAD